MRCQVVDFLAVKANRACVRPEQARDQIEGCGFTRAIGANQRVDLAGAQSQAGILDGLNTAEALVNRLDFEHRAGK